MLISNVTNVVAINIEGKNLAEKVLVLDTTCWTAEIFASRLTSVLIKWKSLKYGCSILFQKWSPLTVRWYFIAIFCNHNYSWWSELFICLDDLPCSLDWRGFIPSEIGWTRLNSYYSIDRAKERKAVVQEETVFPTPSQHGVQQIASIAELLNYQSFCYAVAYSTPTAASVRW